MTADAEEIRSEACMYSDAIVGGSLLESCTILTALLPARPPTKGRETNPATPLAAPTIGLMMPILEGRRSQQSTGSKQEAFRACSVESWMNRIWVPD